ncbi:hypothetical protein PRIPAC_77428 [Pristionchus pacificus]|uniref:G protein-coupled receptor n=1 Tax=Pristionchus pacificus TaxID=54126 RepID=A0A2A6C3E8_PRIPA|nr:hypothetical protein PRIPAC_77428 [Pristionchus pacificus]|eukprot:PDM72762.1 G protein-coupled receptor [Pristionchus pacificus]
MIGQIIPVINYTLNGNDVATVDRYLNEDSHNLAWIRSCGSYYMEKRSAGILLQIILVIFVLIFGCLVGLIVFVHMFYVLHKDSANRSPQRIRSIQRSLIALFLQLAVPFTLFVVPAVIIFIGLLFQDLMSFEFMLGIFLILPWHSVGHNLMLLSITRVYRNRIVMFIKKIFKPRLVCLNDMAFHIYFL